MKKKVAVSKKQTKLFFWCLTFQAPTKSQNTFLNVNLSHHLRKRAEKKRVPFFAMLFCEDLSPSINSFFNDEDKPFNCYFEKLQKFRGKKTKRKRPMLWQCLIN